MSDWEKLASEETLGEVVERLKVNGITSLVVNSREKAKEEVISLLPKKAEVMVMQSVSLRETGIAEAIDGSKNYNSVRNKLNSMDRTTQSLEMRKLGAAPEWTVGSVHAVTEEGQIVIASNTGSQLGAYAYASLKVIWVVGTQKIVRDLDQAYRRIYDYILPLESVRFSKQIGREIKSNVSKLLVINNEVTPGRLTLVFVKEKLGF